MATSNRTDVDILDDFCTRSRVPSETEIIALLRSYAQKGRRSESNRVDLKEAHLGTPREWAEICKDVVAMHNSGGGVLVFGVRDDGSRVGMASSISGHFDPTNINNKLRRCHVSGQVRTSFVERSYYGKMYGFLFVHAGSSLIVFDSDLQVSNAAGKTQEIARAGVLYVRRGSASAPARQIEVDAVLSDLLGRGVRTFLARVEQVATLPATTQLIAQQPGSSSGYVLTSAGYGVPVKVVGPGDGSNSIPLSEALLPDLPFADVNGEVVGQLRQFHADDTHRVRASTLVRWYRQRASLDLPQGAAEFLTLSALDNRGFSGYWASKIPRENLRSFVVDQVKRSAYPARDVIPYLVAAFLWDDRVEILADREGHTLSDRIRLSTDRKSILERSRVGQRANVTLRGQRHRLDDLYQDKSAVQTLFERMLDEESLDDNHRQIAHQFDLWLHADPE